LSFPFVHPTLIFASPSAAAASEYFIHVPARFEKDLDLMKASVPTSALCKFDELELNGTRFA
jgi:hypothetical protein